MRKMILTTGLMILTAAPVLGSPLPPVIVTQNIPQAALVGKGRLTYLMMDIYDAALYAPDGRLTHERPLALSLTYLRDFTGEKIADRTIEEMRDQGYTDELTLAAWHGTLKQIFPDVTNGTTLTGILLEDGATVFYLDQKQIGRIADPDFGKRFFSIWLSPKTKETGLRKSLLNESG